MKKNYFHNNKQLYESLDQIKPSQAKYIDTKTVVDINKLLNRVKLNKIDEKKKNVTYIVYTLLGLCFSAYIIFK